MHIQRILFLIGILCKKHDLDLTRFENKIIVKLLNGPARDLQSIGIFFSNVISAKYVSIKNLAKLPSTRINVK